MVDDVILNKAASIERAVRRAREEFAHDPNSFDQNYSRQDAAILNIQRACEGALDLGQHVVRKHRLGIPQGARDVFQLLGAAGWIDVPLAQRLQKMMGFRNIAVHDYQRISLPVVVRIITHDLDDLLTFSKTMVVKMVSGR
ncbi:MAG: DUF86 domain-containing protein [Myxococcales bacterium]|nr:DUF86 domain-containing protein [Myxococcales bacterium]